MTSELQNSEVRERLLGLVSPADNSIYVSNNEFGGVDATYRHEAAHRELLEGTFWGFVERIVSRLIKDKNVPNKHQNKYEYLLYEMEDASFYVHEGVACIYASIWYEQNAPENLSHYLDDLPKIYLESFQILKEIIPYEPECYAGQEIIALCIGSLCLNRPSLSKISNWESVINTEINLTGLSFSPNDALDYIHSHRHCLTPILREICIDYQRRWDISMSELNNPNNENSDMDKKRFQNYAATRELFFSEVKNSNLNLPFFNDKESMQSSRDFYQLWNSQLQKIGFTYLQNISVEDDNAESRYLKERLIKFKNLNDEDLSKIKMIGQEDWLHHVHLTQHQKEISTVVSFYEEKGKTIVLESNSIEKNKMLKWCEQPPNSMGREGTEVFCTKVSDRDIISFLANSYVLNENKFSFIIHTSASQKLGMLACISMSQLLSIPVFVWADDLIIPQDWLSGLKESTDSSISILIFQLHSKIDLVSVLFFVEKHPILYTINTSNFIAKILSDARATYPQVVIRQPQSSEEQILAILSFYLKYHVNIL